MAAQLIALVVPTIIFAFYLLWRFNNFYSILENDWLKQGIYFASGLIIAIIIYAWRFRFITTAAVILFFYWFIYKMLGSTSAGEFDAFYFSVQFLIFSILFLVGWITGYSLSRSRTFTIVWSVIILLIQIVIVGKTADIKVSTLIAAFVPALAYAFYIIYTAELIRNMNESETKFGWFITKRLWSFAVVLLILFLVIFNIFKSNFQAIEKEWGGAQAREGKGDSQNEEAMTEKDKGGGVKNKDQTKLTGSLSKNKQLIFVAKLDNFLPDGRTPNPLYFTSHYYSKFDTATQTFETDPEMPHNDLFDPDPSKIPLYFSKTDSSAIRRSFSYTDRKVVSTEVYKVNLSASAYLAPSTAFYCQPLSVPKEYKEQFKSAYRAKMWVSELNSAYFIYNPVNNWQLRNFQERRFEKLRRINKISGPDQKFMSYYTYMPKDEEYKKIGELSKEITKDAETPIDKIIAIRDYFTGKDEFGQPLFKYSDNPGIPGMPSANKLTYFLLENRKGYCAYFAGATLFMLRSLGIPSRVVAGYLTEDRSSKNPGWYWFYQDQAHAWVQVYFQGYGWIDFDTTVPDINTQQAAQPDGTPPTDMPQTYMVADGEVTDVDTVAKQMKIKVNKLLYHDIDYDTEIAKEMDVDVSLASFTSDTGEITLRSIAKGMHATAVSHAEVLKNILPEKTDDLSSILEKLPKPVPVDEIKITLKEEIKKQKEKQKEKKKVVVDWIKLAKIILMTISGLVILLFLSPFLIWLYFNAFAGWDDEEKAYHRYRASLYYLNQLGIDVGNMGPYQYAANIDEKFGSRLAAFSNVYQKVKYSSQKLTEDEQKIVDTFYPELIRKVRSKIPLKTRVSKFLNIYNTIHYFSQPKIT